MEVYDHVRLSPFLPFCPVEVYCFAWSVNLLCSCTGTMGEFSLTTLMRLFEVRLFSFDQHVSPYWSILATLPYEQSVKQRKAPSQRRPMRCTFHQGPPNISVHIWNTAIARKATRYNGSLRLNSSDDEPKSKTGNYLGMDLRYNRQCLNPAQTWESRSSHAQKSASADAKPSSHIISMPPIEEREIRPPVPVIKHPTLPCVFSGN